MLVPFPSPVLNFVYRFVFQGTANSHPAIMSDKPKIKSQYIEDGKAESEPGLLSHLPKPGIAHVQDVCFMI